jgi:exopolyphosphatase/guanosine-5'-triphosphate,3'-diphosphate pyrophosphatase
MVGGRAVRLAGIDCGTNSVRLLIADVSDGALADVHRETRIVRLGQDVDRTGRLAPEAIERTRDALADYATTIRRHGAERLRLVATSATRDAANSADFLTMARAELEVEPEVITGAEEAELTFAGAVSVLGDDAGALLVADIGGGSTELVLGAAGTLRAHSMDVGSVRLTERHLRDDPPTAAQIEAAEADVHAAIDEARRDVPLDEAATFVGVAGTITTVAALALGLAEYDRNKVHGARITAAQVDQVTDWLLAATRAERSARTVIEPGRVDVIGGGALVLRTVLHEVGADAVIASEHDILDGIVLSLS